jgi:hypothetical protein
VNIQKYKIAIYFEKGEYNLRKPYSLAGGVEIYCCKLEES